MHIVFDGRVLSHLRQSGVEIYAINLLKQLRLLTAMSVTRPRWRNRIFQQLWEHLILPLKCTDNRLLFSPANIAPLWLPRSCWLVVTVHDIAFAAYPDSTSRFFGHYYRWIMPRILRRADAVITVSEASRQEIVRYYPMTAQKIHVIYHGIDTRFAPDPNVKKESMILFVGSMNRRKNVKSVIEAFCKASILGYKLYLVGGFFPHFAQDEQDRALIDFAQNHADIELISDVTTDELINYYRRAALFVFPSFYEGFGFPPLEAMACGTPVIVSNRSSLPEVCADAAVYVNPADVNALSDAMCHVLSNPEKQSDMIQKGIERAATFSWERSAKEHLALFQNIMEMRT